MTPRAISSGESWRILLAAPRSLKLPIGCKLSALSQICFSEPRPFTPGKGARTSGVHEATPEMRAAASRMILRETRESIAVLIADASQDDLDFHHHGHDHRTPSSGFLDISLQLDPNLLLYHAVVGLLFRAQAVEAAHHPIAGAVRDIRAAKAAHHHLW